MSNVLHAFWNSGIMGILVLIGIAFLFSNNKRQVNWRLVSIGIALQAFLAIILMLTSWGEAFFHTLGAIFIKIIQFTEQGSQFIFGPLMDAKSIGFVFACQVLPAIIFFAALMSILYHLGIMQKIVEAMAWVMVRTMNLSGAESLSVAANVFVGMTEAPLVVRPYISKMTSSELLTLMIGGMATIAGGVLIAYVGLLGGDNLELKLFYAKHLLSASVMSAPAAVVIAKIMIPETESSLTGKTIHMKIEKTSVNIIDAAANGAASGLKLALNVAAMLLAFIALIAMLNYPLEKIGNISGLNEIFGKPLNLSLLLGYLLAPLAWLLGVPWSDAVTIGGLIGKKVVINEFVAYVDLRSYSSVISDKANLIATYALCGFANFSSIAILIGGVGGIAPERRADLARYSLRALLGGLLATLMTAAIAGGINSFSVSLS